MMIGPVVDSSALAIGGLIGVAFKNVLPTRIKETLPLIFGVITISIGTTLINKAHHLPVVVIALIVGTFLGELCYIEKGLGQSIKKCMNWSNQHNHVSNEATIVQLITLIAAFCFGSMGIFGAISEGVNKDPTILLTKAALDFFTGIIFGAALGLKVSLIAIPQFLILAVLYLSGKTLMPLLSPEMMGNFSACGGIIFLATGLRMCGIKIFPVVNMVPALFIVFPLTPLWMLILQ